MSPDADGKALRWDFSRRFAWVWLNLIEFVLPLPSSWTIMKHHETSWNIMKHHETSWNIMKHHDTSLTTFIHCLWLAAWFSGQGANLLGSSRRGPQQWIRLYPNRRLLGQLGFSSETLWPLGVLFVSYKELSNGQTGSPVSRFRVGSPRWKALAGDKVCKVG